MNNDRLKHSISVARKMVQIGKQLNLSDDELSELFLLGYNHDIGYEFTNNGINHNIIGGNILRANGFKYWKEVFYHGELKLEYESLFLDILNTADMQIDKYGDDVGFDKRLEDIKNRYGADSEVYKKCKTLVLKLKEKYNNL